MNVPTKLAAFSALLVAMFVAALGVGSAVGPIELHSSARHATHGASTAAPGKTAEVDGYTVTLTGELVPRVSSPLTFTVAKDGRPVTDLAPYMGAYGHLVAVRSGGHDSLSVYLKGEPGHGTSAGGPTIDFAATVPTAGTYRLSLDFIHDGRVHIATFTSTAVDGSALAPTESTSTTSPVEMHDHDHEVGQ